MNNESVLTIEPGHGVELEMSGCAGEHAPVVLPFRPGRARPVERHLELGTHLIRDQRDLTPVQPTWRKQDTQETDKLSFFTL